MQIGVRRLTHIKGRSISFSTITPSNDSLVDGDILFVNSKGRGRNLRLYAKHLRKLWYVPLVNANNADLIGDLVDTDSIQTLNNKTYKGYIPWFIVSHAHGATQGDLEFLPISPGGSQEIGVVDYRSMVLAPYAGYLDKIIFNVEADADTTEWSLYKTASGTNPEAIDGSPGTYLVGAKVTVETGTAWGTYTAKFGTSYAFSEGDHLAVGLEAETSASSTSFTTILVFKLLVD